jgi:hypothetical protein
MQIRSKHDQKMIMNIFCDTFENGLNQILLDLKGGNNWIAMYLPFSQFTSNSMYDIKIIHDSVSLKSIGLLVHECPEGLFYNIKQQIKSS